MSKPPSSPRQAIAGMKKDQNRGTSDEMEIVLGIIKDNPALLNRVLSKLRSMGYDVANDVTTFLGPDKRRPT